MKVTYDVPDRLTGRQEVEELRRLCPRRTWNFLEIDVPYEVGVLSVTNFNYLIPVSRNLRMLEKP